MTREERRALLGDDVIARIEEEAAAAPDPDPETVEALRRIFTHPGGAVIEPAPVHEPLPQRPAADAA